MAHTGRGGRRGRNVGELGATGGGCGKPARVNRREVRQGGVPYRSSNSLARFQEGDTAPVLTSCKHAREKRLPVVARSAWPPDVFSNSYHPLPLVAAPLGRFEPRRPPDSLAAGK